MISSAILLARQSQYLSAGSGQPATAIAKRRRSARSMGPKARSTDSVLPRPSQASTESSIHDCPQPRQSDRDHALILLCSERPLYARTVLQEFDFEDTLSAFRRVATAMWTIAENILWYLMWCPVIISRLPNGGEDVFLALASERNPCLYSNSALGAGHWVYYRNHRGPHTSSHSWSADRCQRYCQGDHSDDDQQRRR